MVARPFPPADAKQRVRLLARAEVCQRMPVVGALGPYRPPEENRLAGNHSLVVMLVPLVGSWSQILGAFAAHTNTKGELLAKINLG